MTNEKQTKKLDSLLEENEKLYRLTIDSIGSMLHVIDKNFSILIFNKGFVRWNKSLKLETNAQSKNLFTVFPFLSAKTRKEYQTVFETAKPLLTEETHQINGKVITTETKKIPIIESNKVCKIVTIVNNITERKKQVEELKKHRENLEMLVTEQTNQLVATECLAATGKFASTLSNEINNPLQAIITHLEILKKNMPKREKTLESFAFVQENIYKIKHIVQHLSSLGISAQLKKTKINLHSTILKIIDLLKPQMENLHILLEFNCPNKNIFLTGIPKQIKQIVLNLILNAIDNTPTAGKIVLTTIKEKDSIKLLIKDNGRGIKKKDIPRIFEPFFTTKEEPGMGLGLFICQGLVRNHNGSIEVRSKINKGTTFVLTLPISQQHQTIKDNDTIF